MMIRTALAASLLALAACQPTTDPAKPPEAAAPEATGEQQQAAAPEQPAATTPADAATAGCDVKTQTRWGPPGPSGDPSYSVEAMTSGPICDAAVVTMVIRARDGYPAYVWAGQVQHIFNLAGATDRAKMEKALPRWSDPTSGPQTTEFLMPWAMTEGQPSRAEFPMIPADGLDQQTYESIRAAKLPTFCFPQGMESLQCVVLRDGQVEELGVQLFPG